jgi:hypothetical protein
MRIKDKHATLRALVLLAFLAAAPVFAGWEVKEETIGEGVPSWMAVVASQDGKLLFWLEYATDGNCVPQAVLKSDGWHAFAFEASAISRIAAVIRFSRERTLQLPGYAANGFIFMWEMEKEHFAAMLASFAEEKQFHVSLPGREGEVTGTFELAGATEAIREACAACEEGFFLGNDFVFPDSGERLLNKDEVAVLSTNMLRIARNEIFARRGHAFKDPTLDRYFRAKKWYSPTGQEMELSAIEKSNAALIASCE